jgi:hypothetical protein
VTTLETVSMKAPSGESAASSISPRPAPTFTGGVQLVPPSPEAIIFVVAPSALSTPEKTTIKKPSWGRTKIRGASRTSVVSCEGTQPVPPAATRQ